MSKEILRPQNKPAPTAQPEHKPVAWMDRDGNVSDNNDHECFPIPLYTTSNIQSYLEKDNLQPAQQELWKYRRWDDEAEKWELTDDCGWPSEPVYTTSPAAQRSWVGLTDDRRKTIWLSCERRTPAELAKAIESKLKELNHD